MEKKTYRPSPDALLNPRLDANFKAIFTSKSENSRIALKSFLEAILEAEVSEIQIVSNEPAEESATDKQSRFDITCVLNGTEHVNIEMQGENNELCYDMRAEYYSAHLLNHNVTRGMAYSEIPKTYQISVLDFIYDESVDDFLSVYNMRTKDGRELSNRMSIIFIELKKLLGVDDDIKKLTKAEKWGKFLLYADKNNKQEYVKNLCSSEGGLMAAQTILKEISQDEINWYAQWSREKAEMDYITMKKNAEKKGWDSGVAKGLAEGLEKGMQEGIQKGMQQGIQEGLEQGLQQGLHQGLQQGLEQGLHQGIQQKALETAKNFLGMGLSVEQVAQGTGLSISEVEALITA